MLLAKEVLKEIRDAEIAAENLFKESQTKAKEILKAAEIKSKEEIDAASKKAAEITSEITSSREREAKDMARQILEAAGRECEAIKNVPQSKAQKAVNLVIERIVKLHGDS